MAEYDVGRKHKNGQSIIDKYILYRWIKKRKAEEKRRRRTQFQKLFLYLYYTHEEGRESQG